MIRTLTNVHFWHKQVLIINIKILRYPVWITSCIDNSELFFKNHSQLTHLQLHAKTSLKRILASAKLILADYRFKEFSIKSTIKVVIDHLFSFASALSSESSFFGRFKCICCRVKSFFILPLDKHTYCVYTYYVQSKTS